MRRRGICALRPRLPALSGRQFQMAGLDRVSPAARRPSPMTGLLSRAKRGRQGCVMGREQ
ncbi:hypothetical protein HMPREF9946_02460 [Acetobacteraceae bacterium AT-5844]|nr:hypothetical protein HMPREF9946_02460 [Acetobacteraceae bacterium AT-5844]